MTPWIIIAGFIVLMGVFNLIENGRMD
jgi:hypothetical protein